MEPKSQIIPNDNNNPARNNSSRRFLILILILAGFGLIGGYWSIKNSIEQPLAFVKNSTTNTFSFTNTSTNTSIEALKTKDSDSDGITDYDELNTYGTSPYLADSDSDGKNDKQEIDAKTDPNCPEGKPCTAIALFSPTFAGNSNGNTNSGVTISNTNVSSTAELDVAELRTTLRNAGAPQADLDALSDADLLALYQSVVSEETATNTNAATNTATTNTNSASSLNTQELSNLTSAEIRELLKLGGADEETLNSVDDATLKQIFLESLNNVQ